MWEHVPLQIPNTRSNLQFLLATWAICADIPQLIILFGFFMIQTYMQKQHLRQNSGLFY